MGSLRDDLKIDYEFIGRMGIKRIFTFSTSLIDNLHAEKKWPLLILFFLFPNLVVSLQ